MELTAENVHDVLMDCLFVDGEDTTNQVIGEGVMTKMGFHPERLEKRKEDIVSMLNELPEQFHVNSGGGWTFLNACTDKNGYQWTGFHTIADQLVVLGNAIGKIKFVLPRELWSTLPGGMPYLTIN